MCRRGYKKQKESSFSRSDLHKLLNFNYFTQHVQLIPTSGHSCDFRSEPPVGSESGREEEEVPGLYKNRPENIFTSG